MRPYAVIFHGDIYTTNKFYEHNNALCICETEREILYFNINNSSV